MPYPDRLSDVERLVAQHCELKNQSLLLAIYYTKEGDPESVYLLEVISQFGYDEVSEDQDMFEIEYASTPGFTLPPNGRLHLLLSNPIEFTTALQEGWPILAPLQEAVRRGRYQVIHKTSAGGELLALFHDEKVAA